MTSKRYIEMLVGEAVGEASTCWENLHDTGRFDSERAGKIVDNLVRKIMHEIEDAR